jgi:hypothetical protein
MLIAEGAYYQEVTVFNPPSMLTPSTCTTRSIEIKYQLLFGFLPGCASKKAAQRTKKQLRIRVFINNIGIFLQSKVNLPKPFSFNKQSEARSGAPSLRMTCETSNSKKT